MIVGFFVNTSKTPHYNFDMDATWTALLKEIGAIVLNNYSPQSMSSLSLLCTMFKLCNHT